VERDAWLRPALARLTGRERRIIQLRFADGHSQAQIGRRLGVSQMQVSRLLVGILAQLRDDLGTTLTEAIA
jgi:RNA polymerase sigma-B factor